MVRSKNPSYFPLVTPRGKLGNVGTVVATPAVPVPGRAVALWMCDAVVGAAKLLNDTCTRIVCATISKSTSANPVADGALPVITMGPLRFAKYMIGAE